MQGSLQSYRFRSRALAGNKLGDADERDVWVYTPHLVKPTRLPIIMVLAGYGGTHRSLLNYDPWRPNIAERYDAMLAQNAANPAILLFVDGMTRLGGSQFINSPVNGAFQDYLAEEVITWADKNLSTIPEREARAVMGRSSGGFGALRLGLERSHVFSAIASHAGDSAFDVSIQPFLYKAAMCLERQGGLAKFIQNFFQKEHLSGSDFETMMMLAYGASYSPNLDLAFPHIDFPFDLHSGTLIAEVWQHWLAHDPVTILQDDCDALKNARLVFLDAGSNDEYGMHFGARRMATLLQERGVQCIHEEFDGGHRGTAFRYARSLELLSAAINVT